MASATSYGTQAAMAHPAAVGQWALLSPKAPSPLLWSLHHGVYFPSCAVSFSGSLTPSSAHRLAPFITSASTGTDKHNHSSNEVGGSSSGTNQQDVNENNGTVEVEKYSSGTYQQNVNKNHGTANVIMKHSKLICCKLYISETCDTNVIDAIDDAARSDPNNVLVLSKFGDCIYNRVRYTLVSYISESSKTSHISLNKSVTTIEVISPIRDVLLEMLRVAFVHIQTLEGRSGTHPRMGVIDDLSFHPLGDAKMEDAACLARLVASDIGGIEYKVPVFLYGEAHPERKTLGAIRRELGYYSNSDYKELLKFLKRTTPNNDIVRKGNDEKTDHDLDNTRGATTIGAAPFLEGYNVPLRYKDDIKKVRNIVKKLREELGGGREGLPKFLAMELPHGECIEIGCLFDANHLRADQIQDKVRQIAAEQGLEDKVEKGYYTDITKEMILVNLHSKLHTVPNEKN